LTRQQECISSSNGSNSVHARSEQLLQMKVKWPHLYDCIDPARITEDSLLLTSELASKTVDFNSMSRGGRGELYIKAQRNPLVRAEGIRKLFELASPDEDLNNLSPDYKILDVLGGDGVLARAIESLVPPQSVPSIVTSDISQDMVNAARGYGLFALCEPAQNLLLKDNSLDSVIIAYGTHHIPPEHRHQACEESYRVLKSGGRIVLHDFEVNSTMSRWFSEVVDQYSLTGHNFTHFTREDMRAYLVNAGFKNVEVRYLYDPFILSAEDRKAAKQQLAHYLLDMYGLVKLVKKHGPDQALEVVYDLSRKHFCYDYPGLGLVESFGAPAIHIFKKDKRWYIEAPRLALVGVGLKP
jgi:ubiquinone/menaquinone biosynthesis C-methylase UbiE